MLSSAALTKLASFAVFLALVNDNAIAAPGTLTRRSTYDLHKRQSTGGRVAGCGSLKPNLPNVGELAGQCVCYNQTLGGFILGQTAAALTYAINLPVRYPQDTNVNGQCNFPQGGPITLQPPGTSGRGCCAFRCTYPAGPGEGTCGGRCLQATETCQSGVPVPSGGNTRRELRGRDCPIGFTSCAVAFTGGRQFYECLDIKSDLESCGGCMSPDPRYGNSSLSGTFGQDCSAIPNAADVACIQGECVVASCNKKYQLVNNECTGLE